MREEIEEKHNEYLIHSEVIDYKILYWKILPKTKTTGVYEVSLIHKASKLIHPRRWGRNLLNASKLTRIIFVAQHSVREYFVVTVIPNGRLKMGRENIQHANKHH